MAGRGRVVKKCQRSVRTARSRGGTEALFNQSLADKTPRERGSQRPEDNEKCLRSEQARKTGEDGGREKRLLRHQAIQSQQVGRPSMSHSSVTVQRQSACRRQLRRRGRARGGGSGDTRVTGALSCILLFPLHFLLVFRFL